MYPWRSLALSHFFSRNPRTGTTQGVNSREFQIFATIQTVSLCCIHKVLRVVWYSEKKQYKYVDLHHTHDADEQT